MPQLSLRKALTSCPAAVSRSIAARHVSLNFRRHKSGPYGYEQAKALGMSPSPGSGKSTYKEFCTKKVYSKYGKPSNVLL
jgi:hypothetical protein